MTFFSNFLFLRSASPVLFLVLILLLPLTYDVPSAVFRKDGDTVALYQESRNMIAAIDAGSWTGFGGKFPLSQKIVALAILALGGGENTVVYTLCAINFVAFALLLACGYLALRRYGRSVAALFACTIAVSPFLFYAKSSFGEMLAAMLTWMFVHLCLRNAPPLAVFAAFLSAATTKDFAPPFLFLLGLAANMAPARGKEGSRVPPRLISIVAGFLCSMILLAAFNWVRFHRFVNLSYLNELHLSDCMTAADRASYFLAIWFAPNGGVLWFWPMFALLAVLCVLLCVRCTSCGKGAIALTSIVVLATLTWGLSRWYSPLGWICWGPRLILPWLPAILYLLVERNAGWLDRAVFRLCRNRVRCFVLWLVLAVTAFPHVASYYGPEMLGPFFTPAPPYPRTAIIQEDKSYFFACVNYQMWSKEPILLTPFHTTRLPTHIVFQVAFAAALLNLIVSTSTARNCALSDFRNKIK